MLIRALEAKDSYTAGHAERVAMYALYVGEEMHFMPARMERLRFAALMHDIGKLVVPNHILNKPGKLTEDEFARIKTHEKVSVQMLSNIEFLRPIAGAGHSDNTRFDPDDASHPIEPYIVMIADAYDAMTSTRAYRKALPAGSRVPGAPRQGGYPVPPGLRRSAHRRDRSARREARGRLRSASRVRQRSRDGSWVRRSRRPAARRGLISVTRRGRAALVAAAGVIAALASRTRSTRNGTADDLALLAAGVVLGELFVLRLEDRSSVPLSFAVMMVLASSFALDEFACTVIAAEIVAFFLCPRAK